MVALFDDVACQGSNLPEQALIIAQHVCRNAYELVLERTLCCPTV